MLQSPVVFSVANVDRSPGSRLIIPAPRKIAIASLTDGFLDCFGCSFLLAHIVAHEVLGREQQFAVRIRVSSGFRVGQRKVWVRVRVGGS